MQTKAMPAGPARQGIPSAAPEVLFPFLDLAAQFKQIRGEVLAAVTRVLESQHFILGSEVEELEKEIAEFADCRFAVGCASGSDALILTLLALGIRSGDEVITTPFTFVATAGSIARVGARPVFVDIDPVTFNLDPKHLEKAITPRTRAILPAHLFGLSADMDAILEIARQHKLEVIEDAAQAIGARYRSKAVGSLGAAGCFSFFPSKNLGGAGDGGMVTTNDAALAERLGILRVHGSRKKYEYELLGMNSRLDALQAAILRVKLRHLAEWSSARRQNADRYRALFASYGLAERVGLPDAPRDWVHVYNQFVVRVAQRDALRKHLQQAGVPTEVYYPAPLHLQRAFSFLGHKACDFPEAESASQQVLALPIFPELTADQQRPVVAAMASFYSRRSEIPPDYRGREW